MFERLFTSQNIARQAERLSRVLEKLFSQKKVGRAMFCDVTQGALEAKTLFVKHPKFASQSSDV